MEINDKDFSIKLEKEELKTFSNTPSDLAYGVVATNVAATPISDQTKELEEVNDNILVKSPLVGTYYESPSPDTSPFVRVNEKVNKGDTLFIVEAMKVMNEITAPVSGTVVKINVSDATMVEYNQVVLEIKE